MTSASSGEFSNSFLAKDPQGCSIVAHPSSGRARVLHRAASGGADDWSIFRSPTGETYVGSPALGAALPAV
eukprot:4805360-Alexandrium_andersonii.AAC.1